MYTITELYVVTYHHCIQALQLHLLLSLQLHYGDEAYMIGLQILYWLTQQFLYFLSQRKLGATPALPAFNMLLQHTQTKTLDGFLGCLLVSWLEQVKPAENTSSGGASTSTKSAKVSGGVCVTNTNWNMSVKKHWEAANIMLLNKMLEAKDPPSANAPLPKFAGDKDACLSWLIKGK